VGSVRYTFSDVRVLHSWSNRSLAASIDAGTSLRRNSVHPLRMDIIRCLLSFIILLALSSGPAHGRGDELLQASRDGNGKLAVALVESGADVRQIGQQGETALHWAAFYGHRSLARVLIARGALVNAQVNNGSTPLHQAAYKGHLEVVELLVASGASVDVTNGEGLTPTEFAQLNGHPAIVRYLVAHGGRVDPIFAKGARVHSSRQVLNSQNPGASTSPVIRRRTSVHGDELASALRGLSTRLGDLPPLVLKVPEAPVTAARSLSLTRELELEPSLTMRSNPPEQSVQSQGAPRDAMWVQLGSFSTRPRAHDEWRNAAGAHGDLMKGFEPTIATAQIRAKGTFHRLLVGPLPAVDARRLCRDLRARRGVCLLISDPSK